MPKIAVVTDSTAYLPSDQLKKHKIVVTPQVLIWGEKTYHDGVDILPEEFYKRLETAKDMPTTSQVSIITMKTTFEELLADGFEVLGIFLSSKLSGTMDSALQAREMLAKASDKIALVDSNTTAMAMGFVALAAARASEQGASLSECEKLALKARECVGVYFVVDTLEFLRRGGRIGGAQAMLGSALNLKPLLALVDGKIEAVEKIRTKSKALDRLVEIVVEKAEGKTPIRLATLHANAEAEAHRVLEAAAARLHPVESVFASVSPVIGSHAGPGTVGLAYMTGF